MIKGRPRAAMPVHGDENIRMESTATNRGPSYDWRRKPEAGGLWHGATAIVYQVSRCRNDARRRLPLKLCITDPL